MKRSIKSHAQRTIYVSFVRLVFLSPREMTHFHDINILLKQIDF